MDEQPKRPRGRPKGTKNKPGHHGGRPVGSGKPTAAEVLEKSGGVISEPPSDDFDDTNWRKPRSLDLKKVTAPATMLPKSGEATAVPAMIQTLLAIRQTVNLDDPTTIWNAMDQYIALCSMTGMKITNGTMYMALGVNRGEMHNWQYGLRRQNNPEYRKIADTCKEICAAAREQYGIEGQTNPILTIFHQKFYDGFKDNPPDEAAENPLGEITDPQKLAEKYKDIITD